MKKKDTIHDSMLHIISNILKDIDLQDSFIRMSPDDNLAVIAGHKDNVRFTTTLSVYDSKDKKKSSIGANRDQLTEQMKTLSKLGMTQNEIATTLGVTQPTVSHYLSKG